MSKASLFPQSSMMLEHDFVELLANKNRDQSVAAGSRGVVVHLHKGGQACEVEFLRADGSTICVQTVTVDQLRVIKRNN
ncbi:MAG: DUF4926 domain-containing protein [Burkholderiales bacterium PBB3]|nr:MAG: DUF4926 domain-containing protein [Burkholderiales bacterium PBB3]